MPGSIVACGQTTGSYVELAKTRLQPSSWANATCNGGHSGLFNYGWGGLPAAPEWMQENDGTPIPPQFNSLNGNEEAVIVGTGNNEAYFGEVVGACLGHVPSLNAYNAGQPAINNCKNTYVNASGYNRLIEKVNNSEASVGPALDQIHTRSPNAKVFLVGLPRIAPANGAGCMPNPILTTVDAPIYAVWEDQLRAAMKRVAAARSSFVTFVDMQAISGSTHTMCAAWGQKWLNPWSVEPGLSYPGMTVHNSPAGANAIANSIIDSFKFAGLDTGAIAVNPVVNISAPTNNQVFTTTPVTVTYTATDNVGVERCDRANNSQVALTPGVNTITVTCFDFAGNPGSKSVNVTLNDTTKPVVSISAPTPNQVFTTGSANLTYTATDNIGITSCTRTNNSAVPLTPGLNTITVSCSDGSGNSASASVNVTLVDTTKPVVSIGAPTANQVFTTDSATLTYTATDNIGVSSCTRANNSSVPLVPGLNTITVSCSDASGNSASASVNVTYNDITKPVVTINTPTPNQVFTTGAATLDYNATDNVGVTSCTRADNSSVPLVPGLNTITVTCSDAAGNSASASVTVTYNDITKPVVTINTPTPNQVFTTDSATLTYTATDNVGVTSCTRPSNSSVPLVPGLNTIAVTCLDAAGNSTTSTVNVTYTDITKPVVTINTPTPNQVFTSETATLNYVASDNVGVTSCTRPSNSSVPLVPGLNTITVTCSDGAGNSASASVNVTYNDITKPVVTISTPTPNQVFTTASATLIYVATDNVGVTSCTRPSNSSVALVPGLNTVSVTCSDAAGNATTATVNVTYNDTTKPVVTINAPTPNQVFTTSSVTLNYDASDNIGVTNCSRANNSSVPLAPGLNAISVTCFDAAGNSATATVNVTYNDITKPVVTINAPTPNQVFTTSPATLDYDASDNVAVTSCTRQNNSSIPLVPGLNTITVSCSDAAGNSASASVNVTYNDTTKPVVTINAPTPNQVFTTASATLDYEATDNVGVTSCTRADNSSVPLVPGLNTITVSCSDAAGNSASASVNVTYNDITKPVITINAPTPNQVFTTASATLIYVATDNVGVTSCTRANNSAVPLNPGLNTIAVSCSDAAGNSTTASVDVNYNPPDATKPVVTISAPTPNQVFTTNTTTLTYNATDNVGVTSCTRANNSSVTLVPGANTISVTCSDAAGNSTTATVDVSYNAADMTKPVVTINTPTTNQVFTTASATLDYEATDNVGVTSCTRADNSSVPLVPGLNTISVSCSDAAGNSASASVNVTYNDITKPVVTISTPTANQIFTTATAALDYVATDNVGVTNCTRPDNSSIPLVPGLNTISVTCSDAAGNATTATVNVTYNDITKPMVTINTPTPNQVFTTSTATLDYDASDNVGVSSCTRTDNSSVTLVPGLNTITVSCSDAAGNSASASVNVTYNDITKPVITINAPTPNQVFTTDTATLTYVATDNVGVTNCTRTNNSAVSLTPGLNTINVSCSDAAGNSASASVNVTFNDITKPVVTINTPTPNQVFTTSSATLSYVATDNVGVTSCTRASNSSVTLLPGLNTISVTCSDAAGNATTATVNVTYNDITKPVVTINTPTANQIFTTATATLDYDASDNVGVTSCTRADNSSVSLVPGLNSISVTCFDAAGNSTTATVNVTYNDITKPVVTINTPTPNQVFTTSTATLDYDASDNVGVTGCTRADNSSVALTPGSNTISVTCSDAAGNSTTATVDVTYAEPDTTAPTVTITSPTENQALTTDQATLTYDASDNIGVTSCTRPNNSSVSLTPGSNTITVICTDAAGNSGTASVNVTYTVPTPVAPTPVPVPDGPTQPVVNSLNISLSDVTPRKLIPARSGGPFLLTSTRGGGKFRIVLSAAATVRVRLDRLSSGRRRSATPWRTLRLPAGTTTVRITGRSGGQPLAKGRYSVHVSASNGSKDLLGSSFSIGR